MAAATIASGGLSLLGNGRKIVKLSNNWLIAVWLDNTGHIAYFYKSTDNGTTWVMLCTTSAIWAGTTGFSIANYGTKVYFVAGSSANASIQFCTFDATTVTLGSSVSLGASVDSTAGDNGGVHAVSIATDATGNIYVAASAINSTYTAVTRNILYYKSTNGGTSWSARYGITVQNNSSWQHTDPSITLNASGYPVIAWINAVASTYFVMYAVYNGTAWVPSSNGSILSNGIAYTQAWTTLLTKKNGSNVGRIWAIWQGVDSVDQSVFNIRTAYSDDGGTTWSSTTKATAGNTASRRQPSVSEAPNGDIYVFFIDASGLSYIKCANGGTTFSASTLFASPTVLTGAYAIERAGSYVNAVYVTNAGTFTDDFISLNTAPNAPVITYPLINQNVNNKRPSVTWIFSDPDAGDTQSAYRVRLSKDNWATTYTDSGIVNSSANVWTSSIDLDVSGVWYVHVETADSSGAWSEAYVQYNYLKMIGSIKVPIDSSNFITIPVFEPSAVLASNALRLAINGGVVGALNLLDPTLTRSSPIMVQTPSGVRAVSLDQAYNNPWSSNPSAGQLVATTINSNVGGILNLTSTTGDPCIDMPNLGSFDPTRYRYIQVRYRVLSGVAATYQIFFYNNLYTSANGLQYLDCPMISDGVWRTGTLDMWQHANWKTGGNVTGWRYDWIAGNAGVNVELDWIRLVC